VSIIRVPVDETFLDKCLHLLVTVLPGENGRAESLRQKLKKLAHLGLSG